MKGLGGNMKFLFFYLLIIFGWLFFVTNGLAEGIADDYDIPYPIAQPAPAENWFLDIWNGIQHMVDSLGFYWTIFTIDPEISILTALFFAPAGIIIILIFIKDYLIEIVKAIGGLIPFT